MSSLKEKAKAKTKREIWNEPDIIQKPETSVDTLWVRLEDAEREIEKVRSDLRDAIKTNASTMLATIEKLRNENSELKQKLKELEYLVNRLPNVMYNALGDHTFYEENVKELKKKFEELLKEAKPDVTEKIRFLRKHQKLLKEVS
jgi:chromosome segregation ATPase